MLGFKSFYNARRVIAGIELMHMIHKGLWFSRTFSLITDWTTAQQVKDFTDTLRENGQDGLEDREAEVLARRSARLSKCGSGKLQWQRKAGVRVGFLRNKTGSYAQRDNYKCE